MPYEELGEFFARYGEAWKANDAEGLEAFWATAEPAPLYKPEEVPEVLNDWGAVRSYWRHNEKFHQAVELSFSDLRAQSLGGDRLLVTLRMRWDIHFADDAKMPDGRDFAWAGQAMGGDDHVVAALIRLDGTWRLTAWIEAPDAPISYIADLYIKNARPGFAGMPG